MKLVTTEDAQLRCEHSLRPGAPALLLLNPLGSSLEIWDDPFPALCERYEVVRYDMRGHGESTTGSKTELAMEQLARDALAVLDCCGIARAHLCGLSIGGMTAMQIATLLPDRVLKIALCRHVAVHAVARDLEYANRSCPHPGNRAAHRRHPATLADDAVSNGASGESRVDTLDAADCQA